MTDLIKIVAHGKQLKVVDSYAVLNQETGRVGSPALEIMLGFTSVEASGVGKVSLLNMPFLRKRTVASILPWCIMLVEPLKAGSFFGVLQWSSW